MKIIDTHCHYNMPPLADHWQEHWHKAQKHGVVGSVVIGVDIETSNLALEMAKIEPGFFATVGAHPTDAQGVTVEELEAIGNAWANENFIAVGETGLDYYRLDPASENFETLTHQQKEIFCWHLRFAQKHNKPLVLHVRDKYERAYWEALEILKAEYTGTKPFVLHCASGPLEYIQKATDMGGYVGFDGNITYSNARDIRELIKSVPADRLLIETDAPFLAPQAHRGKTCEPWMITETAAYVQRDLALDLNQIFENSQRFFEHSFTK